MFKDKKILVTGGTGFLGSYVVKELMSRQAKHIVIPSTKIRQNTSLKNVIPRMDDRISLVEGDIKSMQFVEKLFMEYDFDIVFHLAAVSEVSKCQNNAKFALDTNINGVINVLEVARLFGNVEAIVVSSSDKAYGSGPLPYKETNPVNGSSVYEVSKSCADMISTMYAFNFNMPVVVTRCANLYGYGDRNTSRLIPNTIRCIKDGASPIIWDGSANATREFLHVNDAVNAYIKIVENIKITSGNAYNIGSGEKYTVEEVIKLILELSGKDLAPVYKKKDFPEIKNQYLDCSKIGLDIDWRSNVSFIEGIKNLLKDENLIG